MRSTYATLTMVLIPAWLLSLFAPARPVVGAASEFEVFAASAEAFGVTSEVAVDVASAQAQNEINICDFDNGIDSGLVAEPVRSSELVVGAASEFEVGAASAQAFGVTSEVAVDVASAQASGPCWWCGFC